MGAVLARYRVAFVIFGAFGLTLAVLLAVSGAHSSSPSCAGQCSAPYELDVGFRPGTTPATAHAVVRHCTRDPIVVGVRYPNPGSEETVVRTSQFNNDETKPVVECLIHAGAFPAWPD